MKCAKCGAEVGAGMKFCGECGSAVASARHCVNCGAKLEPGQAFCTSCGARQETAPAPATASKPTEATPPRPEKSAAAPSPRPEKPAPAPRVSTPDAVPRQAERNQQVALPAVEYIGIRPRFFAALIDWVLLAVLYGYMVWSYGHASTSTLQNLAFNLTLDGIPALVYFVVTAAYVILLEGFLGGTIGKLVMGVRVVNAHGRAPGAKSALIRNLMRIVDFLPVFYLLGLILVATSKQKRRLGDRVAGTFVVSRKGSKVLKSMAWG